MTVHTCTVIISATGDRCGDPAVPASVREGIFGGTIAECEFHFHGLAGLPASDLDRKVEIHWHTWAKQGVVVGESPKSVRVRFVPRAGAEPIVRSFDRDSVRFL